MQGEIASQHRSTEGARSCRKGNIRKVRLQSGEQLTMARSPTQCTMLEFRSRGWLVGVTEHWNHHVNIRQDLFGFVDIVAVDPSGMMHCVQATSWGNISTRMNKIMDSIELRKRAELLCRHNRVAIVGWKQIGGKGSKYVAKWRYLTADDFGAPVDQPREDATCVTMPF